MTVNSNTLPKVFQCTKCYHPHNQSDFMVSFYIISVKTRRNGRVKRDPLRFQIKTECICKECGNDTFEEFKI